MVNISFDQRDLARVMRKLDDLSKMNFTRPMKRSSELLVEDIRNNFNKQGALYQGGGFVRPGGAFANLGRATTKRGPWVPLADSTRRQRKKLGFSPARPIMVRTGKLKRSFNVKRYDSKEAIVGSNIDWAVYHQLGGKKLPQRKLIGFSTKAVKAINIIFTNYIKGIIRGTLNG